MASEEISIRDYMESRFKNIEDKLDANKEFQKLHFDLNEKAIQKAEVSMTGRLESMNEFREQIKEERGSLATKEQVNQSCEGLDARIKLLENSNAFSSGKWWMILFLVALIPTIIGLIALLRH